MDPLRYLLILAACLALTLPLESVLGARVYRRPRRLLATLAPVVAVFAVWDLIAVARGHWWFSQRYTAGVTVAGLPVEEWLFFVVVPLCALLTFEVLGRPPRVRRRGETARPQRVRRRGETARPPRLRRRGETVRPPRHTPARMAGQTAAPQDEGSAGGR